VPARLFYSMLEIKCCSVELTSSLPMWLAVVRRTVLAKGESPHDPS